jgi:hypothetical protein
MLTRMEECSRKHALQECQWTAVELADISVLYRHGCLIVAIYFGVQDTINLCHFVLLCVLQCME